LVAFYRRRFDRTSTLERQQLFVDLYGLLVELLGLAA